jgi:hypothetical protein
MHARKFFRGRRIDQLDPRMGYRTAQNLPMHRPTQLNIAAINGPPSNLVGPIMPHGTSAKDSILGCHTEILMVGAN